MRLAAIILALGFTVTPVVAHQIPAVPPIVGVPVPTSPVVTGCWTDVRTFRTLRVGLIDYCRDSLRYEPGALDCYQFTDQVCNVFVPGSGLTETRSLLHSHVFRCPDGPEPPVCRKLDFR